MSQGSRLPAGWRLAAFETIDSTNAEAGRRARAGEPGGLIVHALEQTAGRGRRGRAWDTPRGNLAATFLLRPDLAPAEAARGSFVAALAVADAVDELCGAPGRAVLKWPNDVLVDGRKICGILMEAGGASPARLDWLAIGIGINLAHHPEGTETPATDIGEICGRVPTPDEALEALARALDRRCAAWLSLGFAPVRAAWRARAMGIGERIRVRLDAETLEGRFVDLDPDGALVLETAGGITRAITAGDVFPLRPDGRSERTAPCS